MLTTTLNSSLVRTQIMALIQSGSLGSDGRLPTERELSDRLGVGRRSIRLALEALEAEGLIWRRQGKGTFAGSPPDPTGALAAAIVGDTTPADIMEARLALEPALAALCARHALPSHIERMRHLAQRTLEAPNPDSAELWDGTLHRLIAQTAGNRPMMTMLALLDEVRGNETWRAIRSMARSAETKRTSDREHHTIIDAIESGLPEAAAEAMRVHLHSLIENLRRVGVLPMPVAGS